MNIKEIIEDLKSAKDLTEVHALAVSLENASPSSVPVWPTQEEIEHQSYQIACDIGWHILDSAEGLQKAFKAAIQWLKSRVPAQGGDYNERMRNDPPDSDYEWDEKNQQYKLKDPTPSASGHIQGDVRLTMKFTHYDHAELPENERWIGEIVEKKGFVESGGSIADCAMELSKGLMVQEMYEAQKAGKPKPEYQSKSLPAPVEGKEDERMRSTSKEITDSLNKTQSRLFKPSTPAGETFSRDVVNAFIRWARENNWKLIGSESWGHEFKTWGGFPVYQTTHDLLTSYLTSPEYLNKKP